MAVTEYQRYNRVVQVRNLRVERPRWRHVVVYCEALMTNGRWVQSAFEVDTRDPEIKAPHMVVLTDLTSSIILATAMMADVLADVTVSDDTVTFHLRGSEYD